MSYSTRYEDLANDSFVLNAKLALRLAGEDAPVVASLEASNATGSKFILRPKSVIRPLSKAGGWTRISEQDDEHDAKASSKETIGVRRQNPEAAGSAVRLFLRRSLHGIKPRECVGCKNVIASGYIRLCCGHYYDKPCLLNFVQTCMKHEALFPPRCCEQPISRSTFEPLMDSATTMLFAEKTVEFSTPKRVYCARTTCRRFLGAEGKGPHHTYLCHAPGCETRTCSRCKAEVKKSVLHACRPEVPRRPSLQGPKATPPIISCPERLHAAAAAPPPPPPLRKKKTSLMSLKASLSFGSSKKAPETPPPRPAAPSRNPSQLSLLALSVKSEPGTLPSQAPPPPPPLKRKLSLLSQKKSYAPAPPATKPPAPAPARPPPPPPPLKKSSPRGPPPPPPIPPGVAAKPPPPPPPPKKTSLQVPGLMEKPKAPPPPLPPPPVRGPPPVPPPVPPRDGPRGTWVEPPRLASSSASATSAAQKHADMQVTRSHVRTSAPAELEPRMVRESVVVRGMHAQARRVKPHGKHDDMPSVTAVAKVHLDMVDSKAEGAGAHRLTALEDEVDQMIRTVGFYACRHEWKVDLMRQVCDVCGRRCSVIYSCPRCVTRACKRCQVRCA